MSEPEMSQDLLALVTELANYHPAASVQKTRFELETLVRNHPGFGRVRLEYLPDTTVPVTTLVTDQSCHHIRDGGRLTVIFQDSDTAPSRHSPEVEQLVGKLLASAMERAVLREMCEHQRRQEFRLSRQLRKTAGHFRFLYEHVPIPCQSIGDDGRLLEVNTAWLQAMGYSQNEVVGQDFSRLLAREQLPRFERFREQLFLGSRVASAELKVTRKDKSQILLKVEGFALADEFGKPRIAHCVFLDVSGQSRLKELILQSDRFSTLAGIAAGMAHEINTPLTGILQSVQLIDMFFKPDQEENRKLALEAGTDMEGIDRYLEKRDIRYFVEGIRSSALKASDIINRLLEFSRPSPGVFERINLATVIDDVIQLTRADYDLKKKYRVMDVRFERELDPRIEWVTCIPAELERVLLTLFRNSVQAMAEEQTECPQITVRSERLDSGVKIEVEDNGPGIPSTINPRVFDPFLTTRDPGEGTGLGLAIAFAVITEKHGGLIWIDSDYRDGARIVMEIPDRDRGG